MSYHVILSLNEKYEPQGVFNIITSLGPVVLLAEKGPRFAEFLDLAAHMMQASGKKVGFVDLLAPTFQAAVNKLLQMDPNLAGNAVFVDQYDNLFEDILGQLRASRGA